MTQDPDSGRGARSAGANPPLPPSEEVVTQLGPLLVKPGRGFETGVDSPSRLGGAGALAAMHVLAPRDGGAVLAPAGTGYVALYLGHLVGAAGHVLALEADPDAYLLLRENLRRHRMSHVVPVAASPGPTPTAEETARTLTSPPATPIDDLLHPAVRVDLVVLGAAQDLGHRTADGLALTVVRWRPTIVMEFSPSAIEEAGDRPEPVLESFLELGYVTHALAEPRLAEDAPAATIVELASTSRDGAFTLLLRPAGAAPPELYHRCRDRLIRDAISSADHVEGIAGRRPLPAGYGFAFDERVVELPWIAAQGMHGACLDAGCGLNSAVMIEHLLPGVESLTMLTLTPSGEERSHVDGVSYTEGDLRALPFGDGVFDTVVCVSTLDHVGMDNTGYGDHTPRASDPRAEVTRAVEELRRVVAPGGRMLLTVPYGAPQDLGWMRQIDEDELDAIVARLRPATVEVTVFAYSLNGWQLSTRAAAAASEYRDPLYEPPDKAVAARAVACLRAVIPLPAGTPSDAE